MKKLLILVLLCASTIASAYTWTLKVEEAFKNAHKNRSAKYAIHLKGIAGRKIKSVVIQIDGSGDIVPLLEGVKGLDSSNVDVQVGGHIIKLTGGAWSIARVGIEAFDGPFAGQTADSSKFGGTGNQQFSINVKGDKLKVTRQ